MPLNLARVRSLPVSWCLQSFTIIEGPILISSLIVEAVKRLTCLRREHVGRESTKPWQAKPYNKTNMACRWIVCATDDPPRNSTDFLSVWIGSQPTKFWKPCGAGLVQTFNAALPCLINPSIRRCDEEEAEQFRQWKVISNKRIEVAYWIDHSGKRLNRSEHMLKKSEKWRIKIIL